MRGREIAGAKGPSLGNSILNRQFSRRHSRPHLNAASIVDGW